MVEQHWTITEVLTGEEVFESDDPKAVRKEAAKLEKAAKADGPEAGEVGGSYAVHGDPEWVTA